MPFTLAVLLLFSITATDLFKPTPEPVLSNQEKLKVELQAFSPLDQLKLINAWLYFSLKIHDPKNNKNLIEGMTKELTGSCGPRDIFIRNFFKNSPIQHRQVNFYGLPGGMVGHSATEVLIDNEWRFVDATFGLYFASPDNPEIPLSLDSARARYPDILTMRVKGNGWKGEWEATDKLSKSLKEGSLYEQAESLDIFYPNLPEILAGNVEQTYITSISAKISPEEVLSIPISISIKSAPQGQIGKLNQSLSDLTPFSQEIGNSKVYTPYCYKLGLFSPEGPIIDKKFNFFTEKVATLNLTLHFVKKIPVNHRKYFLSQIISDDVKKVPYFSSQDHQWAENALTLRTKIYPPSTRVKILLSRDFAKEHSYNIDAITWETFPQGSQG